MSDAKRIAEIRQVYGELSTFGYSGLSPIEAALVDLLACVDALVSRNVELKINEAWRLDRLALAKAVARKAKAIRESEDEPHYVVAERVDELNEALDVFYETGAHVPAETNSSERNHE